MPKVVELDFKDQVYDNIHGYIPLTALELDIIKAPIYQRLRHVKQLGLVNLVFPGAEHSRFAHSLGVMHIVNHLTQALDPQLDPKQQQMLRVGALLHDIGHFPLSHAMEEVLGDLQEEQERLENQKWANSMWRADFGAVRPPAPQVTQKKTKLHEFLGQTLIQTSEIAIILEKYDISPYEVAAIAMGTTGELDTDEVQEQDQLLSVMSQMLHSQVDADRLDYLLRDSNFSGVEAGGFDLPKIYKEACWGDGKYGFKVSGMRAVEQFLMARLTNYRRIVFNKHVHSFEEMAKAMYRDLVVEKAMPSFGEITQQLESDPQFWVGFNDHYFMFRTSFIARERKASELIRRRAERIMNGQPMTELMVEERFTTKQDWEAFKLNESRIPKDEADKVRLATKAGVNPDYLTLVEAGVKIIDDPGEDPINIMGSDGQFRELVNLPESFMGSLVGKKVFVRRLYALDDDTAGRVRAVL